MPRYVARPRACGWIEDDCVGSDQPFRPSLEVEVPKETDTGLLTGTGDPIFRLQPPIGFGPGRGLVQSSRAPAQIKETTT